MSPLQVIAIIELMGCWILWSLAFIKPRKQAAGQQAVVTAPASKWGILLQSFGFLLAWLYVGPMGFQKPTASIIASMILGPVSVTLAWFATRHLGKQWRFQAALSADHETGTDRPLPVRPASHLRLHARHAAGRGFGLDMVAEVHRRHHLLFGRHRGSRASRRPIA